MEPKNETAKQVADVLDILINSQDEKLKRIDKKLRQDFDSGKMPEPEQVIQRAIARGVSQQLYSIKGALSKVLY